MLKYVQLIPFYPLIQLIRVQLKYGRISPEKIPSLFVWLTKSSVIEPFRLIEAMVMALLPERKTNLVFILGYYRSGTTFLQEMLAAGPRHRTLTLFQSVLPEISLCFAWLFQPILAAITRLLSIENKFHNIPFDWNFPGEDDVAINAWSALHDYNKLYQYPSKYESISNAYLSFQDEKSQTKWVENHHYLIKKLSWIYTGKTIVLKSPPNTGRLAILRKHYPDARFVFIHRDPLRSIASARRLWLLNRSFAFERYTDEDVEQLLVQQYLTFYRLFKEQNGFTICHFIRFDELINDPLGTVRSACKYLGLEHWEEAMPQVTSISLKRQKKNTKGRHQSAPAFLRESAEITMVRKELNYQ